MLDELIPPAFREATPLEISELTRSIARQVTTNSTPDFVTYERDSQAKVLECWTNVPSKISRDGGAPVPGWIIWESKVIIHFNAHCCWLNPNGQIIDITPKEDGETRTLFLPDNNVRFQGRIIAGRKFPKIQNKLLDKWLDTTAKAEEAAIRGNKKDAICCEMDAFGLAVQINEALENTLDDRKRREKEWVEKRKGRNKK